MSNPTVITMIEHEQWRLNFNVITRKLFLAQDAEGFDPAVICIALDQAPALARALTDAHTGTRKHVLEKFVPKACEELNVEACPSGKVAIQQGTDVGDQQAIFVSPAQVEQLVDWLRAARDELLEESQKLAAGDRPMMATVNTTKEAK